MSRTVGPPAPAVILCSEVWGGGGAEGVGLSSPRLLDKLSERAWLSSGSPTGPSQRSRHVRVSLTRAPRRTCCLVRRCSAGPPLICHGLLAPHSAAKWRTIMPFGTVGFLSRSEAGKLRYNPLLFIIVCFSPDNLKTLCNLWYITLWSENRISLYCILQCGILAI